MVPDYFAVGVDWTGGTAFCAGAEADGAAAAGAAAFVVAAGFAAAAVSLPCADRKTGISPACQSITASMMLNIPPIIKQMKSSMMPSIPLVSKPLVMSHTMPQIARTINSADRPPSSIQLDLGVMPDSLPVTAAVIGPTYPESSNRAAAEYGPRWHASATWRVRWCGSDWPRKILGAAEDPE